MSRARVELPDTPSPSERYITLVDQPGRRGYILALTLEGNQRQRWYGAGRYGSWASALAAARTERDRRLAARDPEEATRINEQYRTPARGVRYDAVVDQWIAAWVDPLVRRLYQVRCGAGDEGRGRAVALRAEARQRVLARQPTIDLVPRRGPKRSPEQQRERQRAKLTARAERIQQRIWRLRGRLHRVRSALRELDGAPPPPTPQHEVRDLRAQVVRMSRAGYTVRDIATHLGITERAVYSHRHKAGVATPRPASRKPRGDTIAPPEQPE